MTRRFVISPDVNVGNTTDWFILNTKVQRMTGEAFHATAHTDFPDLHTAYAAGQAHVIFANAADTAMLVRDHG
jgi:phosphonate transport system substrate-binding protein